MRRSLKVFVLIGLMACNESALNELDPGYDYYPIESGLSRTYDVYEIKYELIGFDTSRYQLRETIGDTLMTGSGEISYRLVREIRMDETDTWKVDSVWTVRQEERNLVVTANNVPDVKLVFPVLPEASWNKNVYNSGNNHQVFYESISSDDLIGEYPSIEGTELIKVVIADLQDNIVTENKQWEVYGKGVGLIEKESSILSFCTVECDSTFQIEAGHYLRYNLLEYAEN